jgi:hypothetical protein
MNNANENLSPKYWYNTVFVLKITHGRLDFSTTALEDRNKKTRTRSLSRCTINNQSNRSSFSYPLSSVMAIVLWTF